MAAVLILLVAGGPYMGKALTTAEFVSVAACEAAGRSAKDRFKDFDVVWSCTTKGAADPADTKVKP